VVVLLVLVHFSNYTMLWLKLGSNIELSAWPRNGECDLVEISFNSMNENTSNVSTSMLNCVHIHNLENL
jgi:hypothetical protein